MKTTLLLQYVQIKNLMKIPQNAGKKAIAQQCTRLYWHTQEINHTAQKLYDWIAEKPGVIEYRMSLE